MEEVNRTGTGTREWSEHSANCCEGCSHDCRYCYARYNAVERFKSIPNKAAWKTERPIPKRGLTKKNGVIMFPTTHDITPNNLEVCQDFLRHTLLNGNQVLIVSKPSFWCIERLVKVLNQWKSQVMFRFTIGSYSDWVLKFWEPGAPDFHSRYDSLRYAYLRGWQTSVSAEPLLDDPVRLYEILAPFVTDKIWFGCMNKIAQRVDRRNWGPDGDKHLALVESLQTPEAIRDTYNYLGGTNPMPKVAWKDSYKAVLGL